MLLLIDIFSINRSRGYNNPSLDIIIIELCSTRGLPLEEAHEHFFQIQSVISVVILISFQCYCGECSGYIVVILPFLAFISILHTFISGILQWLNVRSVKSTREKLSKLQAHSDRF
jgi:hypothetical protein